MKSTASKLMIGIAITLTLFAPTAAQAAVELGTGIGVPSRSLAVITTHGKRAAIPAKNLSPHRYQVSRDSL